MTTLKEAWERVRRWAKQSSSDTCLVDLDERLAALTAKVEALEAQAAQGQKEKKPLWMLLCDAWHHNPSEAHADWATVMEVVADWLDSRLDHGIAADLRAEAEATRKGFRG